MSYLHFRGSGPTCAHLAHDSLSSSSVTQYKSKLTLLAVTQPSWLSLTVQVVQRNCRVILNERIQPSTTLLLLRKFILSYM
jgi:hypothetical protein